MILAQRLRLSPRSLILLSVAAYLIAVPLLPHAGNGYFTILSIVPVIAAGVLEGKRAGVATAAALTPINYVMVAFFEGSIASMAEIAGLLGTLSLFAVGWMVGYLHDLSTARLRQVVEEKDRLIGTISHELRTPLSTVLGLSHELAERIDTFSYDEIAEFCTLIAQQSADLEALIEDLLVAARADIERIKVASMPVDLAEAARSAVAIVSNRPDWTKSTSVRTNGGGVIAAADGLRVRQIIRNLLQNAERYGGDDVEVLVHHKSGRCAVTVSDNGRGVNPEEIGAIFSPHVRAHERNGNTDSLGLGLYVSQTLARLMKGDLEYRRESGRTYFDLTLPAANNESRALSP